LTSFKISISEQTILTIAIYLCSLMVGLTLDSGWAITVVLLIFLKDMHPFLKMFHEKKEDSDEKPD